MAVALSNTGRRGPRRDAQNLSRKVGNTHRQIRRRRPKFGRLSFDPQRSELANGYATNHRYLLFPECFPLLGSEGSLDCEDPEASRDNKRRKAVN
jgi:hypothetical protein